MQDYPPYLVEVVLNYWTEIESVKTKITPVLQTNFYAADSNDDFFAQEGHTLWNRTPRTTRVARNSNARVESLSDITCDLERARKACLSPFQDMCLMAYYQGLSLPDHAKATALAAFDKIVGFLNQC